MVNLFLPERSWSDDDGNDDANAAKERISLLAKLESIIWSLLTSEGRAEARLWLCDTMSCLSWITPEVQCELFVKLLRSKPRKLALAAQVLQMIFEKRPHRAGSIVAKKSYMLEEFFKGNPRRITQWFGNFADFGESEHGKGARALSQFAFVNRDICWEELEWKGKHGQSPAVVATKPHYFLDLDVQHTIENFLENVPEFWSSDELGESLKDGEIFCMDTKYFVDYFVDLMFVEDSKEVWGIIEDFLVEVPFAFLSHHLLINLQEQDLYVFLDSLRKFPALRKEPKSYDHPSCWLEILLMHNASASIDELLLSNAVINKGRQLLRIICDEEHEEHKRKMQELILEISMPSSAVDALIMKECTKMNKAYAVKWLGLQTWLLQYRLSEECQTRESWEALFMKNGISFHNSNEYDLLSTTGLPKETESTFDDEDAIRARRKKKVKTRKKRRKYNGLDGSNEYEFGFFDTSSAWQSFKSSSGSWRLSTDGYSSTWTMVDLPEHLAKHSFSAWMKWLLSKWSPLA